MSQNGNTQNSLAIQKKNLLNQKLGNTLYSNLEFSHLSSGGETVINFNSLVQDPNSASLEGFSNPLPSQLIGAKITQNRGNVKLHSSARGELQRFTQFYIREDNQIRLTYETEENEIITGMINNVVRNTPAVLDVKKISKTGELAEGQDTFVIGDEYNVNESPTSQLGDLIIHRWQGTETPKLMVRCEGNDIGNDGNYIEVANTIVFKEVGRVGGENVTAFSPNAIAVKGADSFKQEIETIGGQVDFISNWLTSVHGLASNIFQTVANQVDLASFGQRVVELYGIVVGAIAIPSSFLTKLRPSIYEEIDEIVADLSGNVTYTGLVSDLRDLRLFGSRVGNTYTLSFFGTADVNVVNNFGEARVEVANLFSFLSGKTIKHASGSFATNVNSSTDGRSFLFGYCDNFNSVTVRFNFAGDDVAQTNRAVRGTMVLVIN